MERKRKMNSDRKIRVQESTLRVARVLFIPLAFCISTYTSHAQAAQQQNPSAYPNASASLSLEPILAQIDQSAQSAALDIAKLRIEKWKVDSNSKNQAQANAESLQRNLSNALPTLTSGVRAAPQSLAPTFKLYRNLTALYDVLSALTESAGAFGPGQEFDALREHVGEFEGYRRSLGDYLETLTAAKDSELLRAARAPQRATSSVPKKVISDEDTPPATSTSKKKAKKKTSQ
jgi:hypothetical protein